MFICASHEVTATHMASRDRLDGLKARKGRINETALTHSILMRNTCSLSGKETLGSVYPVHQVDETLDVPCKVITSPLYLTCLQSPLSFLKLLGAIQIHRLSSC